MLTANAGKIFIGAQTYIGRPPVYLSAHKKPTPNLIWCRFRSGVTLPRNPKPVMSSTVITATIKEAVDQ